VIVASEVYAYAYEFESAALQTQMPQSTITRNTKNEVVNELPVSKEKTFSW
jgi:hypothetical protein